MMLRAIAILFALLAYVAAPPAFGEETTGLALSNNCTIVDVRDVAKVLGISVEAPDPATQTGGICTFASQDLSQEGVAAYSIVTHADVLSRANYFAVLGIRKCGNVDPHAPNYAQCETFRKLGHATTVAEYYADLDYADTGGLIITREHPPVDAHLAAARCVRAIREGVTASVNNVDIKVGSDTICVHSDTPNAVEVTVAVRAAVMLWLDRT